jgi:hypothetical protein
MAKVQKDDLANTGATDVQSECVHGDSGDGSLLYFPWLSFFHPCMFVDCSSFFLSYPHPRTPHAHTYAPSSLCSRCSHCPHRHSDPPHAGAPSGPAQQVCGVWWDSHSHRDQLLFRAHFLPLFFFFLSSTPHLPPTSAVAPRLKLTKLVQTRRKLLKYLKRTDFARYLSLLHELDIRGVEGM